MILNADSYKYSQFNQYPKDTQIVCSYIESRGGIHDETLFFGLQMFMKEYLTKPITMEDIDEAEAIIRAHGEPFHRAGWEYIVNEHEGRLPLYIEAVPEGTLVPTGNVLLNVWNTDPECYWLTSFCETALLRAIWYPTTVATNSYYIKKLILEYLEKSGDPSLIDFKLHDFGARGVSSLESAGIGGAAHLVNFKGTDTVEALLYARRYYGADMAGFSIPAMEHSTVTSWGRDGEIDSFRNMIKQNASPGGIIACVSDSYNIYDACRAWGNELKMDVLNSGATVVIRPDSGDPASVVLRCCEILEEGFGVTINSKGYKVLNNVRVIQGDGINIESIRKILDTLQMHYYSADNVNFGMGGALLQGVTRDDQKFAMKCSTIFKDGEWVRVFKDPITDPGKTSKSGLLDLVKRDGTYSTIDNLVEFSGSYSAFDIVFVNGRILKEYSFDEVRNNAK